MNFPIVSYIMGGGMGLRLWPLSRKDKPKQFHNILGQGTMLSQTLHRLQMRKNGNNTLCIIAAQNHEKHIFEEIQSFQGEEKPTVIFEPMPKNTAAVISISVLHTLSTYGDEIILAAPADHEIKTEDAFWKTIESALPAVLEGNIVLFGVQPQTPATQYGYICTGIPKGNALTVESFIEKPDLKTAQNFIKEGNFYWNTGIFLFKARTMYRALQMFQPKILRDTELAWEKRTPHPLGLCICAERYSTITPLSIDYGVIEHIKNTVMMPAEFYWKDLGTWSSLRDNSPSDQNGNVLVGDVVALDCKNTYLRSEKGLLCVSGMNDVAVISTSDTVMVTPVKDTHKIKNMLLCLEEQGRAETNFIKSYEPKMPEGFWHQRAHHWLMRQAFPLWAEKGIDQKYGGFYEALDFYAEPIMKPKRMRTLARQIYSFSVAKLLGWDGSADHLVTHGLEFIKRKGQTLRGGWVHVLNRDGSVADEHEDAYDHACLLTALGYAHLSGNQEAWELFQKTLLFVDERLHAGKEKGFWDGVQKRGLRRQNPHMHFLAAFLLWHDITGDKAYLHRASSLIDLFIEHFFDHETGTLGEFFKENWKPEDNRKGGHVEPGHHFEWIHLLLKYEEKRQDKDLISYAEKLYSFALKKGLNPKTGLAYNLLSKCGLVLDSASRSWPQAEALKAALALHRIGKTYMKPVIEMRIGRLFASHIDCAPSGLWIDYIDENGEALAKEVPASIFYHLISALNLYILETEKGL